MESLGTKLSFDRWEKVSKQVIDPFSRCATEAWMQFKVRPASQCNKRNSRSPEKGINLPRVTQLSGGWAESEPKRPDKCLNLR